MLWSEGEMRFIAGNWSTPTASRAVWALAAGVALSYGAALGQTAQSGIVPAPPAASYTVLEHHSADAMSPGDVAVIRAKQHEITTEAAMFGYDLSRGRWSYDETECPAIPNALLLHYRTAAAAGGAQSLFTAIVPRGQGRVLVNPVLYHGATPFEAAIGQKRTMSVFNQAVPAEIAKQDVQPEGHWLTLAICYAEIAGSEPRVPEHPELEAPLVKAPIPTIRLSEARGAMEIQFTGREAPTDYTVWNISVNNQGRAVDASSITYPNFTGGQEVAQAEPKQRTISPQGETSSKVKDPSEPKVRVLPDLPDPAQKTIPQ
jgi:hypothetical protein